jgi:hypothetical protein
VFGALLGSDGEPYRRTAWLLPSRPWIETNGVFLATHSHRVIGGQGEFEFALTAATSVPGQLVTYQLIMGRLTLPFEVPISTKPVKLSELLRRGQRGLAS